MFAMLYLIYGINSDQILLRLINLKFFIIIIYQQKMEVNNNDQIIYPQNIKKYFGSVQPVRSKSKSDYNKVISFLVSIRTINFKFYKNFPSRQEAEAELIRQNHENKLEIKNIFRDCGDHYKVRLSNGKELIADKSDLHFIEDHIWYCYDRNYVNCKINKKRFKFHNLILGHSPTISLSVDHINRNPLDNCRFNLRITTTQIQMINRTPRKGTIQSGVTLCGNYYVASWTENGILKNEKKWNNHIYVYL